MTSPTGRPPIGGRPVCLSSRMLKKSSSALLSKILCPFVSALRRFCVRDDCRSGFR
jgi:hypothetical protein